MYDYTIEINYSNDDEYRKCLSQAFCINSLDVNENEFIYDYKLMSDNMDYIYDITKDIPEFREIYLIYASQMMSTDPDIGIAIAFSYDNFDIFHLCLGDYIRDGIIGIDNYAKLRSKIS